MKSSTERPGLDSSRGIWVLTGLFLLLLLAGNLFLWTYCTRLDRDLGLLAEAGRTLAWQAEVAVSQSERLCSACQNPEICTQGGVPPLGFTTDDLPNIEQGPRGGLTFWLIGQAVLVSLWSVAVFLYRRLNQRHESLKFAYRTLLEAYRRHRR